MQKEGSLKTHVSLSHYLNQQRESLLGVKRQNIGVVNKIFVTEGEDDWIKSRLLFEKFSTLKNSNFIIRIILHILG